jgi:hypothetical protein
MISGTIKLEGRKKMVLVTYYRPPHQTDETINRLRRSVPPGNVKMLILREDLA